MWKIEPLGARLNIFIIISTKPFITIMKRNATTFLPILGLALAGALSFTSCKGSDKPIPKDPNAEKPVVTKAHETAVLLVTFGSTYEGPQKTYAAEQAYFKQKFPDADHYFSFTSRTIINRMHAKGENFLPPPMYLQEFLKAHYKNVFVQSLHIIPGEEYTLLRDYYVKKEYNVQLLDLENDDRNFAVLGTPLLNDKESIERVAQVLADDHAAHLKAGDAVVFVGHGNPEENYVYANMKYVELEDALQKYAREHYGSDKIYVGTVEGKIKDDNGQLVDMGYEYVMAQLNKVKGDVKKVHLQILMSIAGDHANNDMAGTATEEDGQPLDLEDQSWLNRMTHDGYEVSVQKPLKALGDYEELRALWYDHLRAAIDNMGKEEE